MVLDHILATVRDVLDWMPDWLAAAVALSLAAASVILFHGAALRLLLPAAFGERSQPRS